MPHILQPCDVGIFRPLKVEWKKVTAKHAQTTTQPITKVNFAPLFVSAFTASMKPDIIKNAFTACGLYPFDPKRVDYSKCISMRRQNLNGNYSLFETNDNQEHQNEDSIKKACLQLIENNIPLELINSFKEAVNLNQDPSEEKLLFTIWKKLNTSIELNVNTRINPELEHELENDPNSLLLSTSVSQEILDQLSPELIENSEAIVSQSQEIFSFDVDKTQVDLCDTLLLESNSLNLTKTLDDTITLESFSCSDLGNLENTVIVPEDRLSDSGAPETPSFKSPVNLTTTVILESNNNDINCKSREELNKVDHSEIWKKHLHFPQIERTHKKKPQKKEKIFAITFERYQQLEMQKLQLEVQEKQLKLQKQTEKLIKKEIDEKEKIEKVKKREERILNKKLQNEVRLKKRQEREKKKQEDEAKKKNSPTRRRKQQSKEVEDEYKIIGSQEVLPSNN